MLGTSSELSAATRFSASRSKETRGLAIRPNTVLNQVVPFFVTTADGVGTRTVYNNIELFQGGNVAREVDVTDGGHRYLELRVKAIEMLAHVDDAKFMAPADAVGPLGDRVSGVILEPINMSSIPQWPASLRGQHFTVNVEIVVGKNGHVMSAHAVSGPPEAYKGCEDAVRKWTFQPCKVLDKPVEVEWVAAVSRLKFFFRARFTTPLTSLNPIRQSETSENSYSP
jgi:hypothetical protein